MKPEYFKIPKPCSADWNKMTPTEQGAFCTQCNKEVVDLYQTPAYQIKKTIAAKNNPCVRILQSQIDEMNFAEWFRSLSLVKQLRYLFLFTLLLVFQGNSHAQETDTTFIPYSNEYLDALEANEVDVAAEEMDTLMKQPQLDTNAYAWVHEGWGEIAIPPMGQGWMGVPPSTPFNPWGDIEFFDFDIALVGGSLLYEIPVEPAPKNQIVLNENIYEFKVIESELFFIYKSTQRQKVRLKITNQNGAIVYFTPIEVGIGENTVSYPLDKFEFGHYTISIETETQNGSTKVIYL